MKNWKFSILCNGMVLQAEKRSSSYIICVNNLPVIGSQGGLKWFEVLTVAEAKFLAVLCSNRKWVLSRLNSWLLSAQIKSWC